MLAFVRFDAANGAFVFGTIALPGGGGPCPSRLSESVARCRRSEARTLNAYLPLTGIAEEEELHQYVIYETDKPQRKPPRRINLDDPDSRKGKIKEPDIGRYSPPTSLTVHLSKIDMPELRPKPNASTPRRSSGSNTPIVRAPSPQYSLPPPPPSTQYSLPPPPPSTQYSLPPPQPSTQYSLPSPPPPAPLPMHVNQLSEKERKRIEKENRKLEKERERMDKESRRKDKARRDSSYPQPSFGPPLPPPTNKLSRPSSSSSPSPQPQYHTPAHMPHPYQPSPSPSQLGNPAIYAAPPPQQIQRQESLPRPGSTAFPPASFYQIESQDGTGYQSAYVVPGPSGSGGRWGGGRPTSIYGQGGNSKGPVSTLLHKWSKD